jgi:hypothetical protein
MVSQVDVLNELALTAEFVDAKLSAVVSFGPLQRRPI